MKSFISPPSYDTENLAAFGTYYIPRRPLTSDEGGNAIVAEGSAEKTGGATRMQCEFGADILIIAVEQITPSRQEAALEYVCTKQMKKLQIGDFSFL